MTTFKQILAGCMTAGLILGSLPAMGMDSNNTTKFKGVRGNPQEEAREKRLQEEAERRANAERPHIQQLQGWANDIRAGTALHKDYPAEQREKAQATAPKQEQKPPQFKYKSWLGTGFDGYGSALGLSLASLAVAGLSFFLCKDDIMRTKVPHTAFNNALATSAVGLGVTSALAYQPYIWAKHQHEFAETIDPNYMTDGGWNPRTQYIPARETLKNKGDEILSINKVSVGCAALVCLAAFVAKTIAHW